MKRRGDPPDLRLLPAMLAGWAATWLGLSLPPAFTAVVGSAAALGAAAGLARSTRRLAAHPAAPEPWSSGLCALLLVGAGLALSAALHVAAGSSGPVPGLAAQSAFVGAGLTVTGDPRRIEPARRPGDRGRHGSAGSTTLVLLPVRITLIAPQQGPAVHRAYQVGAAAAVLAKPRTQPELEAWLSLLPSQHLAVFGRLQPARGGTREAAMLIARGSPRVLSGPSALQALAGRLRADLRDAACGLPAEEAGVLPALTVGDTSREPGDLAEALKRTGLTYLTVVSGENLVFVMGALVPLARWAGLRGRAVTVSGAVFVLGFTVLARPGPPMVRATVMSLLACVAAWSGRSFRALATMAAAVLILLLVDPWLARTYGFALSVAATAGLLVAAPGWCDRLLDRGVPLWAAAPAAATAAAEVFCEPLLVTFTGSLPLIAVPANVLAVPAAPVATLLGVTAMAADALSPGFGHAVAWVAQWPVRWICLVARTGSEVPGAAISWPRGPGGTGLLLTCYVLAWQFGLRLRRRRAACDGGSTPQSRSSLDKIGSV